MDILAEMAAMNAATANHPDIPAEHRMKISDLLHRAHEHIVSLRAMYAHHQARADALELKQAEAAREVRG